MGGKADPRLGIALLNFSDSRPVVGFCSRLSRRSHHSVNSESKGVDNRQVKVVVEGFLIDGWIG